VAARVCELGGAEGIQIEMTPGQLSDHYDTSERVLRLSAENYHGCSVAAAAIAAHEAGHAIQHATVIRCWCCAVPMFRRRHSDPGLPFRCCLPA
jgi:Zn-dependent membrane protease YugP